ncbi:hypothetical protein LSG31_22755 [Fodinisporobacter ferrooxydans]|uniref:Uncharacterized protein n=1 Tax=Fodinisporobacter ferrooxydans TaxID=2901836 RepID=A0ABY4CJR0_9BACL|nr:hypothetical protein LSG31_22755 [Alicyclobacillaceae bacterium MYW30-H2]
MKWKKWLGIFCCILVLQFGSLVYLNFYLNQPALPVAATADAKQKDSAASEVSVPDQAVDPLISPDRQHIAYSTDQHQLLVDGLNGTVFHTTVGRIVFKKWLDDSTLLYFDQRGNLACYILQLQGSKSVLVDTWPTTKWIVADAFFSPYIELLYIELTDSQGYAHIYRYDAVVGTTELPFGSIRVDHVEYDPVTDTMKVFDALGRVWTYKNNRITRPDGSTLDVHINQAPPSQHDVPKANKNTSKKSNSTGFEIKSVNGK